MRRKGAKENSSHAKVFSALVLFPRDRLFPLSFLLLPLPASPSGYSPFKSSP